MRRVSFPARIDLRYQVMRGIGVREAILIALAAARQYGWCSSSKACPSSAA